ncbi:hypothetical protein [Pedobacter sp. Hv1]|uniref:hypothetical protein n=1 Tax=Pedobacter sp. Hv1 TaxID=1740090 RepID=UPI0006D89608|nr:hypothetical protein [Pedobacter sp. Hv1]KQC01057.1 hypothetical protein AQF98_10345 [Pedobacter sp. Hv1]
MKYTALFLFLIALTNLKAQAQQKKETYQFSNDINKAIEKDTLAWKYQLGATAYSFGQHFTKAAQTWDKNGVAVPKITAADSTYFKSFKAQSALNYIIDRSKNERLMIINEAHHEARHRVFTMGLLQGLYNNGYRLLGLEALADKLINERKFPVVESGFYTQEPQMANLIAEALKIGFTVFGYEAKAGKNGKEREIEQAKNIAEMMAKNPDAKVLIHCGFDHVIEGTPGNKSWEKAMAGRLKEYTNIDPFTIDQVSYSPKGDVKYNSPYINLTNAMMPLIMVAANGKTFNGPEGTDRTDCRVIHPVERLIAGRAHWLNEGVQRKSYIIPKSKISAYPALVLAYRLKEYDKNGIPADIIELDNQQAIANLILAKGDYKIIIKNADYQITNQYQQEIK